MKTANALLLFVSLTLACMIYGNAVASSSLPTAADSAVILVTCGDGSYSMSVQKMGLGSYTAEVTNGAGDKLTLSCDKVDPVRNDGTLSTPKTLWKCQDSAQAPGQPRLLASIGQSVIDANIPGPLSGWLGLANGQGQISNVAFLMQCTKGSGLAGEP